MQNNVGIYASQISGHLWAPNGAYDALATTTLSSTANSITFAGIPQGYKHLQIRATVNIASWVWMRFNDDTASGHYNGHEFRGDGSSITAQSLGGYDSSVLWTALPPGGTYPLTFVTDILDYSSTSKNKTTRTLSGSDANGSGTVQMVSGLWMSTSGITSINLFGYAGNLFAAGSTFALYGVK